MHVIVHGGAGNRPNDPDPRQAVLDEAAATGAEAETPVDAVVTAIRRLESSPRFNAGVGSAVQADGGIRTDAGIMTSDREAGAACSMPGVEHAVSVARIVMEETPHIFVSGDHAVDLADAFDIETGVDLWTDSTRDWFAEVELPGDTQEQVAWVNERFGRSDGDHDTVGAVARAGDRFAAATSTGGRRLALAGRVGDVPQVGSGFYASPAGAASATGDGEDIAKTTLTRRAVRHLERGETAPQAAELAIEEFGELTGANAGVIVLDGDDAGSAYNTAAMQTAAASHRE